MESNIELTQFITEKLFSYQIEHTLNLIYILTRNISILDSSDTGTGKTYTALAVCKQLNLNPIIICPKSVMNTWKKISKLFEVQPIMIVNYETIKLVKYYIEKNGIMERVDCPYINLAKNEKNKVDYVWNLNGSDNVLFIFDEVHKCSNINSENGKLLFSAKNQEKYMLILSATIADHPEKFKLFFYILNFIDPKNVKEKNLTFNQYMIIMNRWIFRDKKPMNRIYSMLYPERSSRMKIDVLGDLFPETQIIAQPYNLGRKRELEIEREYKNLADEMEQIRNKQKGDKGNILTSIMRAQQKIEIIKIPIFVELTYDFIENGFSVVIFVNFTQTLQTLAQMLYTDCLIYGEQTAEQRNKNIEDFQENKKRIIICNTKAGSLGLSLHDLNGNYPRVSLISPNWDATSLIQALGRVHRAGGKSKSLQRIIYVANTVEEKIAEKLEGKLQNLNTINNGDVDLTNITFEKERINA